MINVTKIISSSTAVTFNYFESEHTWGYTTVGSYNFLLKDISNADSDENLQNAAEFLEKAYLRPNIAARIGVDEYKNGIITSLSFGESTGTDRVTASITIEERSRVDTDDGVLFGLTSMIPSPQDIEQFSESYDFSRSEGSYQYTRNASLKYRQDTAGDFLNKAYLFLKNYFTNNRPNFGFQVDGISENGRINAGLKPNISETYDILSKSINFTETLNANRIEVLGTLPFSKSETYALSLDEKGYTTKIYSIDLAALSEPLEFNIMSGVKHTLDQVLVENSGEFKMPLSIEKGLNSVGGKANLTVSFTNDPRLNSSTNIDYSAVKTQSEMFSNYQFSLNISSRGKNDNSKFLINKDYWKNHTYLPYEKIPALFPEISSGALNEISRNVSFDPFNNKVSETSNFSNDPKYANLGDGILTRTVQVSDTQQVSRDLVIPIYGDSEIIVRNSAGKTLGARSISVNMSSSDTTNLMNQALAYASGFAPTNYDNYFLESQQSTLNPIQKTASASLSYNFFDD